MDFRRSLAILAASLILALGATAAWAGDESQSDDTNTAQADNSQASADVKAAKGVENREPVEAGTNFAAGEKVYIWSRITGAKDTNVQHVWKKDGNEIWTATLPVRSNRWTTYSRRTVHAGQYEVVVQGENGTALGSVTFTVQ